MMNAEECCLTILAFGTQTHTDVVHLVVFSLFVDVISEFLVMLLSLATPYFPILASSSIFIASF
jgi:hypothetical protein